jgi:hypothetical protein
MRFIVRRAITNDLVVRPPGVDPADPDDVDDLGATGLLLARRTGRADTHCDESPSHCSHNRELNYADALAPTGNTATTAGCAGSP